MATIQEILQSTGLSRFENNTVEELQTMANNLRTEKENLSSMFSQNYDVYQQKFALARSKALEFSNAWTKYETVCQRNKDALDQYNEKMKELYENYGNVNNPPSFEMGLVQREEKIPHKIYEAWSEYESVVKRTDKNPSEEDLIESAEKKSEELMTLLQDMQSAKEKYERYVSEEKEKSLELIDVEAALGYKMRDRENKQQNAE